MITFGKIRASWGKTGNDADVYMVNPVYAQSSNRIPFGSLTFPLGGVNAYSAGNVLGSNTLSPEMTTESEVGLNMAFFKNRLSFDVSYYNIFLYLNVPAGIHLKPQYNSNKPQPNG